MNKKFWFTVAVSFVSFAGVLLLSHSIFAQTTGTGLPSVTFSVKTASNTDCSDYRNPKTAVSFIANPSNAGFFTLSSNTLSAATTITVPTKLLSNGTYIWHGIAVSSYRVVTPFDGTFTLNATCPTPTTTTTATTTNNTSGSTGTSGTTTTGNTSATNTSTGGISGTTPTTNTTTASSGGTSAIAVTTPTTNTSGSSSGVTATGTDVKFTVNYTGTVDCQNNNPTTSTYFQVTPTGGGSITLFKNGQIFDEFGAQQYFLPNGKYSWRANVKETFKGISPLEGTFTLNAVCSGLSSNTTSLASIKFPAGGSVSGLQTVVVETLQHMTGLELYLVQQKASSVSEKHLDTFDSDENEGTKGTYLWDTTEVPDGEYYLGLRTKEGDVATEFEGAHITVSNSTKVEVPVPLPTTIKETIPAVAPEKNVTTVKKIPVTEETSKIKPVSTNVQEGTAVNTPTLTKEEIQHELQVNTELATKIESRPPEALQDSDKDGISNYDEVNIYHTNPNMADTNKNGIPDGKEILSGNNPVAVGKPTPIVYEDPRTVETAPIIQSMKVLGIVAVPVVEETATSTSATSTPATVSTSTPEVQEEKTIKFSGKAIPNSFVTVYIYSLPIVVTVKADSEGDWSYVLDKEIDNGNHEVYVAITDNVGKIVAKSEGFRFVKEAQAVTVEESQNFVPTSSPEPVGFFSGINIGMILSGAGVLLLVALGLLKRKSAVEGSNDTPPNMPSIS
ncbi:MAG: Ig-like domain-containing protein [Candidatus Pacebacteria bacterium]|nr:Ig-like domain-containing protein [Candidatus Paceibacterota bacterium]